MKIFLRFLGPLIGCLLVGNGVQARVFNIANETFASYFLVNGGTSNLQKGAFENESSGVTAYDNGYTTMMGGEFGFLYSTPEVSFRFGIGVIKPATLKDVKATNASSTELYAVTSDLLGFVPKLGMEINFSKTTGFRGFLVASVGSANITMKNSYVLTSTGQATYAGVADHTVEAKGSATELYGGVGAEMHMTDTTTLIVEGGYRILKFTKLTYAKDVTTFTGAKTSGDAVVDTSGNQRNLDLSGIIATIGFRFYM